MELDSYEILPREFYRQPDVVEIARQLLGKVLFTSFDGQLTAGKIVETEAYDGRNDKACHAFLKRTKRTEIMYGDGGYAYIYLCYGIHHLFNIVTNEKSLADAILVRAIEPIEGLETMMKRRGMDEPKTNLTAGPGMLSQAMGIKKDLSGSDLVNGPIWIAEDKTHNSPVTIEADRRVGVNYAGEDALLPWRFYEKDNRWISRKKQKDVDINQL
jgi:DNA-3-methyladenine glycosylase